MAAGYSRTAVWSGRTPHPDQRPLNAEPASAQPCGESRSRVECIDHDWPVARRPEGGARERLRDVGAARNHGSDLIEKPPRPTYAIVRQTVTAPHDVRVLRRAMERPVEERPTRSAEDLTVPLDDDVEIDVRERPDVPDIIERIPRQYGVTRGPVGDIPTEHRLVFKTVPLIDPPSER